MIKTLRQLNRKTQKGITLVELLLVIVITAIIGTAMVAVFADMWKNNQRLDNRNTAISYVQNAGNWISVDARNASGISPAPHTPFDAGTDIPFTLSWPDGTSITYDIASGTLTRSDGTSTTPLADDLQITGLSLTGSELTVILQATVGTGSNQETVTRTYEVSMRNG